MAGKPADPPPPDEPSGEGSEHERPTPSEREGPVTVERLSKHDGRALILYTVRGPAP